MPAYFNMYPSCVVTKGRINSLIIDYKNELYFRIPTILVDAIKNLGENNFDDLLLQYQNDPELSKRICDLKNWLVKNNLGMMATRPNLFPPLKNNFEFSNLSNAVIEVTNTVDDFAIRKILSQLTQLKCRAIQLIFLNKTTIEAVRLYMNIFEKYIFESIEIVVMFIVEPMIDELEKFLYQNLSVKKIYVFGCSVQRVLPLSKLDAIIVLSTRNNYDSKKCGFICKEYFSINIMTYFESQTYNSCLNQKIAIDAEGNLKNCLASKESFGKIHDCTIADMISNKDFKKYWNITKNQIDICKSCEFRYICTDCRAYVEDPDNIYSKPLKCGYDPNTGEWKLWSSNPLKQKAIKYYDL